MSLANIGSRPIRQAVAISFDDANYFATELLHTTASDTNARAVGIHALRREIRAALLSPPPVNADGQAVTLDEVLISLPELRMSYFDLVNLIDSGPPPVEDILPKLTSLFTSMDASLAKLEVWLGSPSSFSHLQTHLGALHVACDGGRQRLALQYIVTAVPAPGLDVHSDWRQLFAHGARVLKKYGEDKDRMPNAPESSKESNTRLFPRVDLQLLDAPWLAEAAKCWEALVRRHRSDDPPVVTIRRVKRSPSATYEYRKAQAAQDPSLHRCINQWRWATLPAYVATSPPPLYREDPEPLPSYVTIYPHTDSRLAIARRPRSALSSLRAPLALPEAVSQVNTDNDQGQTLVVSPSTRTPSPTSPGKDVVPPTRSSSTTPTIGSEDAFVL